MARERRGNVARLMQPRALPVGFSAPDVALAIDLQKLDEYSHYSTQEVIRMIWRRAAAEEIKEVRRQNNSSTIRRMP